MVLYNIQSSIRNRVARATNLLLSFTVIAYLGDLLLTQVSTPQDMERLLRTQWIGIAFVPAAYAQLSAALLEFGGGARNRTWRRMVVVAAYILGASAVALTAFTDLIVKGEVVNLNAPQLDPGQIFPIFMILSGACIVLGFAFQLDARQRSRTATMKRRITYIIATACGPVISVFPYLAITGQSTLVPAPIFWAIQILGNSMVGITVFFMTYSVSYIGISEPDRVVRLRLIKFLARGPLVAIGVLVMLVAVDRAGRFLGLPAERATPFVVAAGIVVLQWIILMIKPVLERWFYFDERDQVVRIQELRDRVLTTQDLHQFLESVLANVCELLQVETAFVASYTVEGAPQVEVLVGELLMDNGEILDNNWQALKIDIDASSSAEQERFTWDGYWIFPLYDRNRENVLGILGARSPQHLVDLPENENERLTFLIQQAASALEDQILQQDVFAAMEGLLLKVQAAQQTRLTLTQDDNMADLMEQEEFITLVRDALSHYWGGPKLLESPLLKLQVVRQGLSEHQGSSVNAMRAVLHRAVESLRPEGKRSMTTTEWILYNILELKFLKGYKVRDIAQRLAMSESDLYRKQRVAIEAVARTIAEMEQAAELATPSEVETSQVVNGHQEY
ncbi:MAG: hypothetical protein JXA42_05585 [Anaerolineales bacterium]|nr:hypothetical protein [Anaerolineales bacterium]